MTTISAMDKATYTYLGFDYGLKYIGVAVGQSITMTANPVTVIKAKQGIPDWQHIAQLIQQWQPQQLIVGLPLNMDGSTQSMTQAAQKFGRRLHGRFHLPVVWQDERLSTKEALSTLAIPNKLAAKQRESVDSVSAQLILQSWLNQQ